MTKEIIVATDVVTKAFKDLDDKKRLNEAGKLYPREGLEVTEERKEQLREGGFIVKIAEKAAEQVENEEFPVHKGGGNYVLSNGESVKGKDAAIEAEQALKVEDQPKDGE